MKQPKFRESQQPYAIVIGLDDIRGVYAVRTLARHKVPIIAIAKDSKSYSSRMKVCEQILFANTNTEEFLRTLETLGPKLSQKAVLFPCLDTTVSIISQHRDRLKEWYHIVLPARNVVEMMMDKINFYSYAQKEGFPIPPTFFLYSRADAEHAATKLTFPCILKPSTSKSLEWLKHTRLKAFKVSNPEELLAIYNHYSRWADAMIAQEWIEGTDANLYACHCYFNAASEPLIAFTSRKLRQWPPETGDACLAQECRNDTVLSEALRLFQSVNFQGLCYIELKRDECSGKYFIVEPNIGRTSGRMGIVEAGGVELLYTMYCDTIGWPLPANRGQKYEGVKWIYFRRDLQSALYYWRRGDLSLKEWWSSWRGPITEALFSWSDLGLFLSDLQNTFRLFLSRQERRKRDYQHPLSESAPMDEYAIDEHTQFLQLLL